MRRPRIKGKLGTARWNFGAPILLTFPFALLAIASLRAGAPFTATRWLGSSVLFALCIGSLAAAIRGCGADDGPVVQAGAAETLEPPKTTVIDVARLRQPLVLAGRCNEGQLATALIFAGIAVAATIVVACLLAGQLQRTGPVSTFGVTLGLLLISPPALIGLHLAIQCVSVELTLQGVSVAHRKGFFHRARTQWDASEIESVRLVCARGSFVQLVIDGRSRSATVPLCGLGFEEAHAKLTHAS